MASVQGCYELNVLRVFCDGRGQAGNPLGLFVSPPAVPRSDRQAIAARLGFSETVFIDDLHYGALAIFTPTTELSFAGHPLVGAAWLLRRRHRGLARLRPPAGEVAVRQHGELTWISADPAHSPTWRTLQMRDPGQVIELDLPPADLGHTQAWAWQDEQRGVVRARVFARDYGIEEDPATGSAAIVLCAQLGRPLRIIQGPAGCESELRVRPLAGGLVELGGRVAQARPPAPYRLPER